MNSKLRVVLSFSLSLFQLRTFLLYVDLSQYPLVHGLFIALDLCSIASQVYYTTVEQRRRRRPTLLCSPRPFCFQILAPKDITNLILGTEGCVFAALRKVMSARKDIEKKKKRYNYIPWTICVLYKGEIYNQCPIMC